MTTEVPAAAVLLQAGSEEIFSSSGCLGWLFKQIHRGPYHCPHCREEIREERDRSRFIGRERVRCSDCGRSFDWRTGTILAGTALSSFEIVLLVLLLGAGASVTDIANRLRIDRNTVRDWRERLSLGALAVDSHHTIGEGSAPRRGEGDI